MIAIMLSSRRRITVERQTAILAVRQLSSMQASHSLFCLYLYSMMYEYIFMYFIFWDLITFYEHLQVEISIGNISFNTVISFDKNPLYYLDPSSQVNLLYEV